MKRLTLVVATIILLAPAVFADQITLKNGDRLSGDILRSDEKLLIIKTEFAGEVAVQWAAIEAIRSTQTLHLTLKDGQVVVGTATPSDSKVQVQTKEAGPVVITKDAIVTIRSDKDQAAYEEAEQRLRHPRLGDLWSGSLDTGLSLTRGNSAIVSYTLSGRAVRQTDRDKITVYTALVYGKNDITSPGQLIARQITGGIRGDINFSPRWFAFAATDFNSNALQNLELQNVVDGGVGSHVIKTKNTQFDVFGGAGYNQEFFRAYSLPNPAPPPATILFPAVTQRSAAAVAGEQFDTKLGARSSFSETFTYFPNLSGPTGYRFTFNSVFATSINRWLGWQLSFNDIFFSNPPIGIKGNDLILSTGLRLTFGTTK